MLKIMIGVIFTLMAVLPAFAAEGTPLKESSFTGQLNSIKTQLSEMPNSKYVSQSQLRDLLTDRNPEIRKTAVKNSKSVILNSSVYGIVIDIFENTSERLDIRIEAARALSYATGSARVVSNLKDALRYDNQPKALKIMTYKALWKAASSRSTIQSFLVNALQYTENDPEIKGAVIWSLFDASRNSRVYKALLDLLKYGNDKNSVKIEAVKSLYGAMGNSRVKDVVLDIAKYKTSDSHKDLRKTAITALSTVNGQSRVKSLLEDLYKYNNDDEIRAVALEAAVGLNQFKRNDFFHLSYRLENGGAYNPLEKE